MPTKKQKGCAFCSLIDFFLNSAEQEAIKKVLNKIDLSRCPSCNKINLLVKLYKAEHSPELSGATLKVNLKEIRKNKKITQEYVSTLLGFSPARYSVIENNKKKPSILLALKIAKILNCDVNEIFNLELGQQND